MKYPLFCAALVTLGLTTFTFSPPVRAAELVVSQNHFLSDYDYDSAYPYEGHDQFSIDGTVLKVDPSHDRITVESDDNRFYRVDTYNSEILLGRNHDGDAADLSSGIHVHIVGTLLGRNLIEADRMRIQSRAIPVDLVVPPPVRTVDPQPETQTFSIDGVITRIDADSNQVVLLTDDDHRYTLDTHNTDIILRGSDHSGSASDLARNMRVHVVGIQTSKDAIEADRIRILPVSETLAPLPVVPDTESLDKYTGIIIDARSINIMRSPAPTIHGPDPDFALLYPDRSHVPTPDEVQDESIVRYYRSEDAARDGVGGSHPLIIPAEAVVGPAHDGVLLSAENAALFQALDKRLHFTRTWKVGFLIPADQ